MFCYNFTGTGSNGGAPDQYKEHDNTVKFSEFITCFFSKMICVLYAYSV